METHRLPDTSRPRRRLAIPDRVAEFRAAAEQIGALASEAAQRRDLAIVSIHAAMEARLKVGVRLIELSERFAGEFQAWLEGYCSDLFHFTTAFRWMAKVRDLKLALGKEEPTFEELKKAQQAAETLPEAVGAAPAKQPEPPPFRLRLEIPGNPKDWEPGIRREFISQAKPIVDLYNQAIQIQETTSKL
jgi:hypothetical protein